jgi:hypothetical protein
MRTMIRRVFLNRLKLRLLSTALSRITSTVVTGFSGIEDAQCVVATRRKLLFDIIPVSISSITVSGLNSSKNVLRTITYI